MAAGVGTNNIYPPVVSPFSPNFVITGERGCRVYFSISAYNSIDEYQDIHITVTRQSDNITALDKTKYPSQIKIMRATAIQVDEERTAVDKYYITLTNSDIEGGFQTGIVYKVQMRFSNNASGLYTTPQKLDAYLSSHLTAFSEWSQVCLVQGINQPELQIKNSAGGQLVPINNIFNIETLEVVGTLITDDTDPLEKYIVSLYDADGKLIETSGVLFPPYQSSKDQLNYVFKYMLQDGQNYNLEVYYMTAGLYEQTITYPLFTVFKTLDPLSTHTTLTVTGDVENGRLGIKLFEEQHAPFSGVVTFRRTSSKSDFKLWEDVHTVELRADHLDYTWYDYTIESGVWYKYCVQRRNADGDRGIVTQQKDETMIIFDDMFLDADGMQLRIQFDPDISSFQTYVSETKIDTIGDKYPHIMRNGATEYRQFPIAGLISCMMDDWKVFASREELYSEKTLQLYKDYNYENRIDKYNDITYERDFREKVMAFLNKHNVKLFRSATEGNILVKLMNITFTPNKTLGRRIYSFSCQAYEVDDFTINNCNYYGVQEVKEESNAGDTWSEAVNYNGQWDSTIPADTEFIHADPAHGHPSVLEDYYSTLQKQNYILSVDHLDYLRIEMYDEPYLIADLGTGNPEIYNPGTVRRIAAAAPSLYMGYLAEINGKTIVIPADGIYVLQGEDIEITSLRFKKDTNAEIRYHAQISQVENEVDEKVISVTNFQTRVGQEWGAFIPGESLYNRLWNKYYMEHPNDYYQALTSIDGIRVQANPGTLVFVREDAESAAQRHIIGQTESLDFWDEESMIGDAYFMGLHFEQATEYEMEREILPEGKCNITDIVVDNLDKIENPKDRYVYYLQTNMMRIQEIPKPISVPELATLITAKGLPIFFIKRDQVEDQKNYAIIDKADEEELKDYLHNLDYEIYVTDSILFTEEQQIKTATAIEKIDSFEFVMDNEENKVKLQAFKVILEQYGNKQITAALKRQIWKDIAHNVSDYYIYLNHNWFVFDEETQDAVCPVPVSIDYVCETMKAYYRTKETE